MSSDAPTTNKQWFVVHTYSGFENKVSEAIQSRAKIFGMGEKIARVLVPTEKVVEVRNKQKRETEQKFFPGYVLIEMELTDETWHLVRSTPKVTGFVGSGNKPVSLPAEQVEEIVRNMEAGIAKASAVPHKDKIGKVTRTQVREIAQTKLVDLNTDNVDSAMRIIEGTARSMGIEVV